MAGVDEAGRGSLCGPVVAGAVLLDAGFYGEPAWLRKLAGANDSKKLSPEKRAELRARIAEMESEGKLKTAWAAGSVMEISAHNILGATRLAMARCIAKLAQGAIAPLFATAGTEGELFGRSDARTFLVLVDGLPLRPFAWAHESVKGGDGRSLAIALASIIAKVERDRMLVGMHERYPQYGFATHKGYGTPEHVEALRKHGSCPEHRDLFVRTILAGDPPPPEATDGEFSFE
ncbi:MAG: ribonuclease HII [Opitutales bacterium]|nr:MAG: ribonuclease HII [Opitutales bacterium]